MVGDGCLMFLTFVSCGEFKYIVEYSLPNYYPSLDIGYGWALFLAAGFLAFFLGLLNLITAIRGIGENTPSPSLPSIPSPPADDPTKA